MADFTSEQILDQLVSLQGRMARQEAELARYRRRRRARPLLPLLAVGLLVALAPFAVLAATPFTDLTGGVHDGNIDAIYTAGITIGCDPTHYCPKDTVTREQMASFLARLGGLGTNPPVANAQVLQGYAPSGLVRVAHGQQGSFTHLLHGGLAAPPVALASLTLDVPGPGFVLLSGTFNASRETGTGFAPIEYRIRDFTGGEASPPQTFTLGPPGTNNLTGSTTTVLAVPAAGVRAYDLEVRNMSNDNNAFIEGGWQFHQNSKGRAARRAPNRVGGWRSNRARCGRAR
jgi:hypothetical protein